MIILDICMRDAIFQLRHLIIRGLMVQKNEEIKMISKPKARLYVENPLTIGSEISLSSDMSHYVANVLRLKEKDFILLFNEKEGEFLGRLTQIHKKHTHLILQKQTRTAGSDTTAQQDLWLAFAPLKKDRLDFLIEKSVELGVNRLCPIQTDFTDILHLKMDRLEAQIIEAAEQTERLTLPVIEPMIKLRSFLDQWPKERTLFICLERGKSLSLKEALSKKTPSQKCGFLIGPAGGLSDEDISLLLKYPFVTPIHLGPRILRAETAAIAVLSAYQAFYGDWTHAEPNQTLQKDN